MVQAILRLYSYVFHLILSLFLLGLGTVAALSDNTTFELPMLPWSGEELTCWLLGLGAIGLVSVVLASRGKMRVVFLLWALVAFGLMGRGIFASNYQFDGVEEFRWALFLLTGFAAAALGAWSRFRQPIGR